MTPIDGAITAWSIRLWCSGPFCSGMDRASDGIGGAGRGLPLLHPEVPVARETVPAAGSVALMDQVAVDSPTDPVEAVSPAAAEAADFPAVLAAVDFPVVPAVALAAPEEADSPVAVAAALAAVAAVGSADNRIIFTWHHRSLDRWCFFIGKGTYQKALTHTLEQQTIGVLQLCSPSGMRIAPCFAGGWKESRLFPIQTIRCGIICCRW